MKYSEAQGSHFITRPLALSEMNILPSASTKIPEGPQSPSTAQPEEGFNGISYLARYISGSLQLLTLETINGKTDLYLRRINAHNGAGVHPKPLGLDLAANQPLSYIKSFTAWLNDKTIVVVNRTADKTAGLQLSKVIMK